MYSGGESEKNSQRSDNSGGSGGALGQVEAEVGGHPTGCAGGALGGCNTGAPGLQEECTGRIPGGFYGLLQGGYGHTTQGCGDRLHGKDTSAPAVAIQGLSHGSGVPPVIV
jgi:hypothetical protein